MENAGYVFAAFGVVWAFVFVYIFVLLGRQKKLQREIDSLKQTLQQKMPEK